MSRLFIVTLIIVVLLGGGFTTVQAQTTGNSDLADLANEIETLIQQIFAVIDLDSLVAGSGNGGTGGGFDGSDIINLIHLILNYIATGLLDLDIVQQCLDQQATPNPIFP